MFKFSIQIYTLFFLLVLTTSGTCQSSGDNQIKSPIKEPENLIVYVVNPLKTNLSFYYKNEAGRNYKNHENLKSALDKENKKLIFAVNGGMYNRDHSPQGLYIEKENQMAPIDTQAAGYGNFYLQPNGIFYLTKNKKGYVKVANKFINAPEIEYATQSGPMLLIEGEIHPKFRAGSTNLHIRNGVGILPDGQILFVMSKEKINFYDLATYFKEQGCQNALYLDGFVSRTYLPSKNWIQTDGNFGVIIAESEPKQ